MIKPPVCILCHRLDMPGGVERSVTNIANLFQLYGHDVTILVLDETSTSFYPLKKGVQLRQEPMDLGITSKGNPLSRKISLVRQVWKLRQLLKEKNSAIVLSTDYSLTVAAWFATRGLGITLISREAHHFFWLKRNRFWEILFRFVYPKLDMVVALNKTEEKYYRRMDCRTVVIPNYVAQQKTAFTEKREKVILSIGWIIRRKGFDLIPVIAERLLANQENWRWLLIGKGPEENKLSEALQIKGLADKVVIIHPASHDLQSYYKQASIFALTSRSEGFPNVLLEALSFGLPAVAFECLSGPGDIITDGENGYLIPLEDTALMADRLTRLLSDTALQNQMGENAQRSMEQYASDSIYAKWEKLFEQLNRRH